MTGRKTFKKEVIDFVFLNTTTPISGENSRQIRKDEKNRIIAKAAYGNIHSSKGWNIHHIDGDKNNNSKSNLIALHFETHLEKHKNEK